MFSGELIYIIISSNSHLMTLSINIIQYNMGFKMALRALPKLKIIHFSLTFV